MQRVKKGRRGEALKKRKMKSRGKGGGFGGKMPDDDQLRGANGLRE